MLWLSGLMGLMAVGAFTLLWFLPVRRKDTGDVADETSNSLALALAGPDANAADDAAMLQRVESEVEDDPDSRTEAWEVAGTADDAEADASPDLDGTTLSFSAKEIADGAEAEDWFADDADMASFDDFDPQEDDLVVVWDDSQGPLPDISVVRADEDPAIARVVLGDTILAQFRTTSDRAHNAVALVPLSTARSLGWAHP